MGKRSSATSTPAPTRVRARTPPSSRRLAGDLGQRRRGLAGEYWLDIRRINDLAPIMQARFQMCKAKGFDGIEPDNIDG